MENGEWKYAPTYGTYVRFDLILTLTEAGIAQMGEVDTGQLDITQALTSDAIFTVHLGDFVNSGDRTEKDGTAISGSQFNDYETKRGHSYTYTITINNTTNIYAEVTNDEEVQAKGSCSLPTLKSSMPTATTSITRSPLIIGPIWTRISSPGM